MARAVPTIQPGEQDTWTIVAVLRQLLDLFAFSTREILPAQRIYIVATTGSDTNDGLSFTTAFLTIQHAVDVVSALDTSLFTALVVVAPGTYNITTPIVLKDPIGAGSCFLIGDESNPSNVVVSHSGIGDAIQILGARKWNVQGFKLTSTVGRLVLMAGGAVSTLSNMEYGATNANLGAIVLTDTGTSVVTAGPNNKWSGNTVRLFDINNLSSMVGLGTFTVTSNITVSQTIFASGNVFCQVGIVWSLGAFTVTGQRYFANLDGDIQTFGQGPNYFPGTIAGVEVDGGKYR